MCFTPARFAALRKSLLCCIISVAWPVSRNASGITLDGNRMIWTWKLDLLFFHVSSPFLAHAQPFRDYATYSSRITKWLTQWIIALLLREWIVGIAVGIESVESLAVVIVKRQPEFDALR